MFQNRPNETSIEQGNKTLKMMIKTRVSILIFCIFFCFSTQGCEAGGQDEVLFAQQLMSAIKESNKEFVEGVLPDGDTLHPDIEEFIFGGVASEGKSLLSIMDVKDVSIKVRKLDDWTEKKRNIYQVFFVIHKREADAKINELSKLRWMEDYAACLFQKEGGDWKAVNTFCYAETEGPFFIEE